jgi:GTP-binding protein
MRFIRQLLKDGGAVVRNASLLRRVDADSARSSCIRRRRAESGSRGAASDTLHRTGRSRHAKPLYCNGFPQRGEARPRAGITRGRSRMKHPLHFAEFVIGAASESQLPPPGPPEIAFAGRSNAGKSSAINTLANRTRLAFTSKTPGRTQQINMFALRSGALLADLPGYGYAAVPRDLKRHWQNFLSHYLATRQSLVGLVLVVDARHGLADLDRNLLEGYLPSGRPVMLLATKMDKLPNSGQRQAEMGLQRAVAESFPAHAANVSVVPFSSTRRIGIEAADAILARWLGSGT